MSMEAARADLAKRGLDNRIIEPAESTATVELAAKALGTEPGAIAKTLSFLVNDTPILILAEGTARIDNRKYREQFHAKAKMIPGAECEALVGHAPGGVCPFGRKPGIAVYLDVSLRRYDVVYPAAGNDRSGVRLTPQELFDSSEAAGWIDVCREAAP